MPRRLASMGAGLVLANVAVWALALLLFAGDPVLLAAGLLAYGLGLRHAFDADHLAVIDNVVRAAVHTHRAPVAAGLWFSLGHSTVVVLACLAAAGAAAAWRPQMASLQQVGETVGPLVSSTFRLAVAMLNGGLLASLIRRRRDPLAAGAARPVGVSMRWLPAAWRARLASGWGVYPLGLLMGLGFDTASEVALLALAAAQATSGQPLLLSLVFPALFTAAMALADTADGVLMLRSYRWAADDPKRRFYCNVGITGASVAFAAAVGGWQLWQLAARAN